jgi:hypothetical protein
MSGAATLLSEGEALVAAREMLELARTTEQSWMKFELGKIAPRLPKAILPKALEVARGIVDPPSWRAEALAAIAPLLPT